MTRELCKVPGARLLRSLLRALVASASHAGEQTNGNSQRRNNRVTQKCWLYLYSMEYRCIQNVSILKLLVMKIHIQFNTNVATYLIRRILDREGLEDFILVPYAHFTPHRRNMLPFWQRLRPIPAIAAQAWAPQGLGV